MDAVLYDLVSKKNWVCEEFLIGDNFTAKSDIVFLEGCAGGGGGHATGTGGASGAACNFAPVPVTKGSTYAIAIGASGSIGGDGGTTSFGSLLSLPGGKAGVSSGSALGGLQTTPFPNYRNGLEWNAQTMGSMVSGAGVYWDGSSIQYSGNNRYTSGNPSSYTSGAGGYFGPGGTSGNAAAANSGAGGGTNAAGGSGRMRVYYLK